MIESTGNEEKVGSDQCARFRGELPKSTLDAIKRAQMDSRHDHLNALLDP